MDFTDGDVIVKINEIKIKEIYPAAYAIFPFLDNLFVELINSYSAKAKNGDFTIEFASKNDFFKPNGQFWLAQYIDEWNLSQAKIISIERSQGIESINYKIKCKVVKN
ncbi:hypothetical protein N5853_09500 [Bartonella sp. HY329]|uniref:hypothetical protein n=1 Tax=unclassified Bartonella TaxID=2645622 RepID=UPI0021C87F0D|nr:MULTISPECIES: hypothetical protein [unclassified Bartonella]UXM94342.1 hypothetical protein N5853_09500 [Bartonella sp. HY329]UXN08665.1 hypothetical protein N5852_09510 [Bartonella sp. HY328]